MYEITDFRKYLISKGFARTRTVSLESAIHSLWRAITYLDDSNLALLKEITVNDLVKAYGEIYPTNRTIDLEKTTFNRTERSLYNDWIKKLYAT